MKGLAFLRAEFARGAVPVGLTDQVLERTGTLVMAVEQGPDTTTAAIHIDLDDGESPHNAVNKVLVLTQGLDLGGDIDDYAIVGKMGHRTVKFINRGDRIHLPLGSSDGANFGKEPVLRPHGMPDWPVLIDVIGRLHPYLELDSVLS